MITGFWMGAVAGEPEMRDLDGWPLICGPRARIAAAVELTLEKREAQRREADRAREKERLRERAKVNFLPHGSEREARRRRRQIERGQLKAENGLAL